MIGEEDSDSEPSQLFFQKCPELAFIQSPFALPTALQELQRRDLAAQFELIRALTETKKHRVRLMSNSIVENKKNRYPQQSIYQHTRVLIRENEHSPPTYINANAVAVGPHSRIFITQAPLESTQPDFQLMLRQEKVTCVVMLCNIFESGKTRCFDYFSNRNRKIIEQIGDYATISQIELPNTSQQSAWTYTHVHYSQWPDRGLPSEIAHLKMVVQMTKKFKNVCIHCSAGLGRSGVLASAMVLQSQIQRGEKVSVFGTVRRLRERRFGAVQNSQQYRFIYQYLCQLAEQPQ